MTSTVSSPDMSSVEVLHTQNDSGSFPSNEFSLLPDADQSAPNGDINAYNHFKEDFNLTNMRSSFVKSIPDCSIEDLQVQLNEMVVENTRLKENMNKTNSLMEAQIETIQAWRDHMLESRKQLEENLKKANEKIGSLEKENSELMEKINSSKPPEQQKALTCEKCTMFESSLTGMLGVDYVSENQHLLIGWSDFREYLPENLKTICRHMEVYKSNNNVTKEEQYILDCYILILKFKIAFMEGNSNDVQPLQADLSLKTDEETGYEVVCKKLSEAEKTEIKELREKLVEKENQLAIMAKSKEEFVEKVKDLELKIKEMEMSLKTQYEVMTNKLKTESALTQRYRERCVNFEQQIEEYERKLDQTRARMSDFTGARPSDDRVVEELREQVQNLQEILKLEQKTNKSDKEKLYEEVEKREKLQEDYERATQLLDIQLKDEKEKNEKLAKCESDTKRYLEEADHQTAKLFAVQEQLIEVTNEYRKLQEEVNQMKDKENIAYLKDQVSSYKRDFLEMEAAKNVLSDDVDRLKKQLDRYEKSSPRRASRGNERRSSEQRDQNGATAGPFECPVCRNFQFTNEKAAQNHVERCLKENNP